MGRLPPTQPQVATTVPIQWLLTCIHRIVKAQLQRQLHLCRRCSAGIAWIDFVPAHLFFSLLRLRQQQLTDSGRNLLQLFLFSPQLVQIRLTGGPFLFVSFVVDLSSHCLLFLLFIIFIIFFRIAWVFSSEAWFGCGRSSSRLFFRHRSSTYSPDTVVVDHRVCFACLHLFMTSTHTTALGRSLATAQRSIRCSTTVVAGIGKRRCREIVSFDRSQLVGTWSTGVRIMGQFDHTVDVVRLGTRRTGLTRSAGWRGRGDTVGDRRAAGGSRVLFHC